MEKRSFNPTLVRLRPHEGRLSSWVAFVFQSHAGSIEAGGDQAGATCVMAFNPTLVRLRPRGAAEGPGGAKPFQSHAGSIEARAKVRALLRQLQLSIPRWFD